MFIHLYDQTNLVHEMSHCHHALIGDIEEIKENYQRVKLREILFCIIIRYVFKLNYIQIPATFIFCLKIQI